MATVPAEQLIFPGKLVICSDIPYPPQEFFDDAGNPIGSDIEIGKEIAKRLGLTVQIENSVFDTIIPALTGGKCDIIISAQNITADRLGQVDMIPYFQAGQAFVVAKGNPAASRRRQDLCGKTVAAETGTTEARLRQRHRRLQGHGGLHKQCTDAGKPKIDMQGFQKDTDALLGPAGGQVDAYFADSPRRRLLRGPAAGPVRAVGRDRRDRASRASASPKDQRPGLATRLVTALLSMVSDGTYQEILDEVRPRGRRGRRQ